jgi:peptide/nickel transport system substrate-binding protein
MRVDKGPFSDVRVRQAIRLAVDRPQMIEVAAGGYATLGNDLFGKGFPGYDTGIPQREQDLDQARALLRQAGRSDLSVELVTSPIANNLVQAAQVLAKQASGAGIDVRVKQVSPTDFYGAYLQWPFAQDWLSGLDYLLAASYTTLKTSFFNSTHFDDPRYAELYAQANAIVDPAGRADLIHAMQQIDHEQGGYLIPYFPDVVDAGSSRLSTLPRSKLGVPLGGYRFDLVGFAA